MTRNPFDRSEQYDFDLPAEGEDYEESERERALGPEAGEQAQVQKAAGSALTESRAFAILAEFAEKQKQTIINQLLCNPTTDGNRDEFNYLRGQAAGLLIAVKFAKALAEGAEATIELLQEAKKNVH